VHGAVVCAVVEYGCGLCSLKCVVWLWCICGVVCVWVRGACE